MSVSAVRWLVLSFLALAVLTGAATSAADGAGEPWVGRDAEATVTVLRSDVGALEVVFDLGAYTVRESTTADGPVAVVEAAGMRTMQQPGRPDLPARGVLLGVPPSGELELVVPHDDGERFGRAVHLRADDDGAPADVGAGLYPDTIAELTDEAWFRGQRVARLEFHPFRYAEAEGILRVIPRIRATIRLVGGGESKTGMLANPTDPLTDSIMRGVLANFETARRWRADGSPPSTSVSARDLTAAGDEIPGFNIHVKREGMYQVTGADLAAAGAPIADIKPSSLGLTYLGQKVALRVSNGLDDALDPQDWFAFYAEPDPSKYTDSDVYQLNYDSLAGDRMERRSAAPAMVGAATTFTDTARVESNMLYVPEKPRLRLGELDPHGIDRWYWQLMSAPTSVVERVELLGVAGDTADLTIGVTVVGRSDLPQADPDHILVVSVNGVHAGELSWDGDVRRETLEFGAVGVPVTEGSVDVRLIAPGRPGVEHDQFYVDAIDMAYPRRYRAYDDQLSFTVPSAGDALVDGFAGPSIDVYNVSKVMAPVLLTGAEQVPDVGNGNGIRFNDNGDPGARAFVAVGATGYFNPSAIERIVDLDWHSSDLGADLIVVRPSILGPTAARLAEHRARSGARVVVADLQGIYDWFGHGAVDPAAIRAYLAYAYADWQPPAPSAAILLGDATYDPRQYLADSRPTLLPTFLQAVDPWLGEVATDNPLATLSGDDKLPDLAVGRLPASDAAEAEALVDKIISYEVDPVPGDWSGRMLFAADNPDGAGDFHSLSDAIVRDLVPAEYSVEMVYLGRTHSDGPSTRSAVVDGLERGNLITHYSGHGTATTWAAEDILRRSDMQGLTNAGRLPVLLDMTCLTGYFVDPVEDGISETALAEPGGGAVGAFSPTGFGVATGHDVLDRAFLSALLGRQGDTLGAATLASKVHLFTESFVGRDLLDTFVLLGDPGLIVPVLDVPLPTDTASTPGATRTSIATGTQDVTLTPVATATPEGSRTPPSWTSRLYLPLAKR